MILNLKLDPTNWLEATWFEQTFAPDTIIPAKEAVLDEEGNEISPATPEIIEPGQVTQTQIKCVSYHPTQIDMLRADALELGTDLAEYETLLSDWVNSYVPPAPEPESIPVYSCTPWEIRKALNALGLRQAVEDAVAASTDQDLKDGWEFATEFRSDDPFVISMGAVLGKSEEETAQLIQYASTL